MGYYSAEFKAIADDPWGEAMVPRLSLRLLNGSNGFLYSDDLTDDSWVKTSGLIAVQSLFSTPTGVSHLILLNDPTPAAWESVSQTRVNVQDDRFVMWGVFKRYTSAPSDGDLYLLEEDDIVGVTSQQFARFVWNGEVLELSSSTGLTGSGVVDLGDDWYIAWISGDTEGYNGFKGNAHSYHIYPDGGSGTQNRGVWCSHLQLELGSSVYGPRKDGDWTEGPWGSVRTLGFEVADGGIGQLMPIEPEEKMISMNPVNVKREREFGVVESQQWQASFTNANLQLTNQQLSGSWAVLEMGFPSADVWALSAQGRIGRAVVSTNLTVVIDVDSPMRQMIDGELKRWVFFDPALDRASLINDIARDENSDGYDDDLAVAGALGVAVKISNAILIRDQKYIIEYTAPTVFKITDESGTSETGFVNTANAVTAAFGITIAKEGWAGTYAAGDQFWCATSDKHLAADTATPIALLMEILKSDDYLDVVAYDVLNGYYYQTPLYDEANMWTASIPTYSGTDMSGEWDEGAKVTDLIQGILRLIHGSIYTMPNGLLALWETRPKAESAVVLNGDFEFGQVHIISASHQDLLEEVFNAVRYKFKSLNDGSQSEIFRRDPESLVISNNPKTIDLVNWRVDKSAVDAATSKAITRLRSSRRSFMAQTILNGATLDMNVPVSINEPFLGISQSSVLIAQTLDVDANEVNLELQHDPLVLQDYAKVGQATVGGSDVIF